MVKVGVVLFLVFEFVVFVRFDKLTRIFNERNKTAVAQENSTDLQMTISIKESPTALNVRFLKFAFVVRYLCEKLRHFV